MAVLHTDDLTLRPARPDDLDAMFAILSDPRTMRYWSTPPHPDPETTRAWLDRMLVKGPDHTAFIIEKNGKVIGEAGASTLPEVGLILHPDIWGQGVGRAVMRTIIDHLFATTPTPVLMADIDPRNLASLGLFQSLGFVETHRAENTFCLNGEWCHSVYLALARPAP